MEDELLLIAIEKSQLPNEAYSFVPPDDIVVSRGGKIPLRNIFFGQQYSSKEQEKIMRLKKEIEKNKVKLPEGWDDCDLLRIIHGSGYKTRKAFKDLKASIDTFGTLIPRDYRLIYSKVFKVISEGFLYIFGRDRFFRPTLIMDVAKINVKKNSLEDYISGVVFLVEFTKRHLLIPGKIENWINITDMANLGINQLPLTPILKLSQTLQKVYKCRLGHCFVLNPPSSIYYIWSIGKRFIDKSTQEKVVIAKGSFCEQMVAIYEPEELEEKFGGKAQNTEVFWPPSFPSFLRDKDKDERPKVKVQELKIHTEKESRSFSEQADSDYEEPISFDAEAKSAYALDSNEEEIEKFEREEERKEQEQEKEEDEENIEFEINEKKLEEKENDEEEVIELADENSILKRKMNEIPEVEEASLRDNGCLCAMSKCVII